MEARSCKEAIAKPIVLAVLVVYCNNLEGCQINNYVVEGLGCES